MSVPMCHLVLIETSSNQPFIFATNRLGENIGASEMVRQVGTRLALQCVARLGGPNLWHDQTQSVLSLADPGHNPWLESDGSRGIEILVATSGKMIALVKDRAIGKNLIRDVTARALRDVPGLEVLGVVSKAAMALPSAGRVDEIHQSIRSIHRDRERITGQGFGLDRRFPRLPVAETCDTSGLPAAVVEDTADRRVSGQGDEALRSWVTVKKRASGKSGWNRLKTLLHDGQGGTRLMRSVEDVESHLESSGRARWAAVIHADGNGFGTVFRSFGQYSSQLGDRTARDYLIRLRSFSQALDDCAMAAFREALLELPFGDDRAAKLPVVPLVVGGDDLTVYCDGSVSLRLAEHYLRHFEKETAKKETVANVAREAFPSGAGRLSACAGVAIIKPHYPFHAAYSLSAELLQLAKTVKKRVPDSKGHSIPCSALAFHALYDADHVALGRILARIRTDQEMENGKPRFMAELSGQPYVVSDPNLFPSDNQWIEHHRWSRLEEMSMPIRAARAGRDRQALPGTILHALREALFLGRPEADAELALLGHRYPELKLLRPKAEKPTLFWQERDEDGDLIHRTSFLDLLDYVEFAG
jgi:hypothetical protein